MNFNESEYFRVISINLISLVSLDTRDQGKFRK